MEYITLKGIISVQKTLSGELSQDVLVLVGKSIAEEVIEARDGNECLLDKLNTFVEKIEGKQLSTNDYTNADKSKVDNLPLNTNSELNKKADSDKVYTKRKVDSKLLNKADKSDSLSGYGITDAYTKTEIDSKISNVYEIKGSSTIANLPTNPEVGDVYNITDSGTITGTEIEVSVGDNIVYTSDGWDKLAATVDLSGYQEKLIFDDTPTADSTNPVTSGGVKTELDKKADSGDVYTKTETDTLLSEKADSATTLDGYGITDAYTKTEVDSKENALILADERLKYYGDKDIVPSDESYFTVNETGETITGLTDTGKTQTELVIPYKIDGVEITNLYSGIGHTSILSGNSVITKIVIPNNVTSIEMHAFEMCSSLTSINIPDSVTSIGEYAFYGCSSLTLVNIPDNVTSIRDYAFSNCTSLASINIPDSVTSIGNSAFSNCTSLTSINILDSVTSIGNGAFDSCSSLTSINIPNSVTTIGHSAFGYCTSLTSINIPNSVTSIGDGAFSGCTNLTIYCEQGSYAETYAKEKNIPVVYTDVKATSINPTVKTALEDTITVNTIYDLGVQTALSITLSSGQIGDFIQFDFISGETATTLTINSSSGLVGFDLIPETNTIYTLYFDWGVTGYDGTDITYGWRCNYSEYSIVV